MNGCEPGGAGATLHPVEELEEWEREPDDDDLDRVELDDFEVDPDDEPWLDDAD